MTEIYYKATRANGVSGKDRTFVYHIGMNIHPAPDKEDKSACGVGIHLAKTIGIAKKYVPKYKEIYEARAGVILGEDDEKVRCASCLVIRLITTSLFRFPQRPSLNDDWLDKHCYDITSADIANQTLEIRQNGKRITITVKMKSKDREFPIKNIVRQELPK